MRLRGFVCVLTMTAVVLSAFSGAVGAEALKEGDSGEDVRKLQETLVAQGFLTGAADGVYGEDTKRAIEDFQRRHNLVVDGVCGDQTFEILLRQNRPAASVLKPGMEGESVKKMQEKLIAKGYLDGIPDGIYGESTTEAVQRFQESTGLYADGICGEATMEKLDNSGAMAAQPSVGGMPMPFAGQYAAVGDVLKPGMYGEGVTAVQNILIEKGYLSGEADGIYGEMTVHAMRGFQKDAGLDVDGVCGGATYDALHGRTVATDSHGGRVVFVRATAYSAFDPGNGSRTSTGQQLRRGIIAVDPNFIPLGTRVYIPGYGNAVAADIGHDIKGNRIDVAFDTREEALAFGQQDMELYILD